MAYKQPKNTPMHNDGASEPITAAILGALKLGKVIAGAVKGAKAVGTAAKGAKAAATAAKGAKAAKAASTAAKGAKTATTSLKMAPKGAKAITSVKPKAQLAKVSAPKAPKATMKQKLFKAGDAISDKYNMSLGKISKATGQDFDKLKGVADDKLKGLATSAVGTGVTKLKEGQEVEEPQGTQGTTPLYGYSNPDGPDMFAHRQGPTMGVGVKYDNHGASKPLPKTKTTPTKKINGQNPSLNPSNIQLKNGGLPEYFLNNFSAPINIKGVQVDAGDIMRGLYMGGKMLSQSERYQNLKKSAQQNKKERQIAKIAKSSKKDILKDPTKAQNLIDYKSNNTNIA